MYWKNEEGKGALKERNLRKKKIIKKIYKVEAEKEGKKRKEGRHTK